MKRLGVLLTSLKMGEGYPPHFIRLPQQFAIFILLGGEKHCEVSCFALEHHTMTRLIFLKHYPHDQRTNHGDAVCPTPRPLSLIYFLILFAF